MEIEFKKDLRHNYMIITKEDTLNPELYSVKMLEHQSIDGILPFELRRLDNKVYYYYEITAKQSMINIFDKTALHIDTLKQLFSGILDILERAYEYLLPEDDFAVSPEFIYLDIQTNNPYLSYIPGYQKNINKQMNSLLEFLMNKVDYSDKDAVLLVYQLYAVSREEEFTFDQLLEVLQRNPGENLNQKVQKNNDKRAECTELVEQNICPTKEKADVYHKLTNEKVGKYNPDIPIMEEKIESEMEVACYPMQSLILSGICIIIGILLVIFSLTTGILYNSFGNRIDYSKLFALLLIVLCIEGYALKKILDKKNKISKMVKTCEYVDPRKDFTLQGIKIQRKPKAHITDDLEEADKEGIIIGREHGKDDKREKNQKLDQNVKLDQNARLDQNTRLENFEKLEKHENDMKYKDKEIYEKLIKEDIEDDDYNPTCLLNSTAEHNTSLILKALEETNYKDIAISSFPFFIGKLKKNVDYCLEKDVVSRFHAKITKEEDKYYLIDLNSTNGTFVNSVALMIYQKKEIKIGDEIVFANIKYRFTNE